MYHTTGFERIEQIYQILKKLNYLEDQIGVHEYFGGHSIETVLGAAIEMILKKNSDLEYKIQELEDRLLSLDRYVSPNSNDY